MVTPWVYIYGYYDSVEMQGAGAYDLPAGTQYYLKGYVIDHDNNDEPISGKELVLYKGGAEVNRQDTDSEGWCEFAPRYDAEVDGFISYQVKDTLNSVSEYLQVRGITGSGTTCLIGGSTETGRFLNEGSSYNVPSGEKLYFKGFLFGQPGDIWLGGETLQLLRSGGSIDEADTGSTINDPAEFGSTTVSEGTTRVFSVNYQGTPDHDPSSSGSISITGTGVLPTTSLTIDGPYDDVTDELTTEFTQDQVPRVEGYLKDSSGDGINGERVWLWVTDANGNLESSIVSELTGGNMRPDGFYDIAWVLTAVDWPLGTYYIKAVFDGSQGVYDGSESNVLTFSVTEEAPNEKIESWGAVGSASAGYDFISPATPLVFANISAVAGNSYLLEVYDKDSNQVLSDVFLGEAPIDGLLPGIDEFFYLPDENTLEMPSRDWHLRLILYKTNASGGDKIPLDYRDFDTYLIPADPVVCDHQVCIQVLKSDGKTPEAGAKVELWSGTPMGINNFPQPTTGNPMTADQDGRTFIDGLWSSEIFGLGLDYMLIAYAADGEQVSQVERFKVPLCPPTCNKKWKFTLKLHAGGATITVTHFYGPLVADLMNWLGDNVSAIGDKIRTFPGAEFKRAWVDGQFRENIVVQFKVTGRSPLAPIIPIILAVGAVAIAGFLGWYFISESFSALGPIFPVIAVAGGVIVLIGIAYAVSKSRSGRTIRLRSSNNYGG